MSFLSFYILCCNIKILLSGSYQNETLFATDVDEACTYNLRYESAPSCRNPRPALHLTHHTHTRRLLPVDFLAKEIWGVVILELMTSF